MKIQTIQKLNTTEKKQTTQNTAKQNHPGLVAFYDTRPGNEMGLFYNAPEPTRCDYYSRRHGLTEQSSDSRTREMDGTRLLLNDNASTQT